MGSRRETVGESLRLPRMSRRAVLGGTSVVALAPQSALPATITPTAADDATRQCARWLHVNSRIERLQNRWAKLEAWLAREHDWLTLSPTEQQALPWSRELRDIDGCLDLLFEQREALLESLPTRSANLTSVIARLAVVERLIWSHDHPEAYALITGCLQDLKALSPHA